MPRFEDPSATWPENEFIWKMGMPESRKRHMRQLIASGKQHIFREVTVEHPDYVRPYDADSLHGIIEAAEDEFTFLKSIGIHTPDVTWRIIQKEHRSPHLFAKIDVIDGITPPFDSREGEIVRAAMTTYFGANNSGRRLFDIDPLPQYIIGVPRTQQASAESITPQIYLVDLDTRFA